MLQVQVHISWQILINNSGDNWWCCQLQIGVLFRYLPWFLTYLHLDGKFIRIIRDFPFLWNFHPSTVVKWPKYPNFLQNFHRCRFQSTKHPKRLIIFQKTKTWKVQKPSDKILSFCRIRCLLNPSPHPNSFPLYKPIWKILSKFLSFNNFRPDDPSVAIRIASGCGGETAVDLHHFHP